MQTLAVFAALLALPAAMPPAEWAVLVAGSHGWQNYRHQSDLCRAYHALKDRGIPRDLIITVRAALLTPGFRPARLIGISLIDTSRRILIAPWKMFYDDIAFNPRNPFPGRIFNAPDGPDVYHGCTADYSGAAVSPTTFLKVLTGRDPAVGSGKVLRSGADDNVLVYIIDHGGPGVVSFPAAVLAGSTLRDTFAWMKQSGRFKELVVLVETCYSGSLFDGTLSDHTGVWALTAANASQLSYGRYFNDSLSVEMSDLFSSVLFDEIVDAGPNMSLAQLFRQTAATVAASRGVCDSRDSVVHAGGCSSNVSRYGDPALDGKRVSSFVGVRRGSRAAKLAVGRDFDGGYRAGVPAPRHAARMLRHQLKSANTGGGRFMLGREEVTRDHVLAELVALDNIQAAATHAASGVEVVLRRMVGTTAEAAADPVTDRVECTERVLEAVHLTLFDLARWVVASLRYSPAAAPRRDTCPLK